MADMTKDSEWTPGRGGGLAPTDCAPENRGGGEREASVNAHHAPFRIRRKVCIGGPSLWASSSYVRHCPAARQRQDIGIGMSHLGFCCVVRRR